MTRIFLITFFIGSFLNSFEGWPMELGRKLGRTLPMVNFIFTEGLDKGLIVEISNEIAIVCLVGIKNHRCRRLSNS